MAEKNEKFDTLYMRFAGLCFLVIAVAIGAATVESMGERGISPAILWALPLGLQAFTLIFGVVFAFTPRSWLEKSDEDEDNEEKSDSPWARWVLGAVSGAAWVVAGIGLINGEQMPWAIAFIVFGDIAIVLTSLFGLTFVPDGWLKSDGEKSSAEMATEIAPDFVAPPRRPPTLLAGRRFGMSKYAEPGGRNGRRRR